MIARSEMALRTADPATLRRRVAARREVDRQTGCWIWQGGLSKGYGKLSLHQVDVVAHRAAWVAFRGPVPNGLTLDHLCRNRACVNPDHLEPVTLGENTLRGLATSGLNSRKSHCHNGHPFDAANTYLIERRGKTLRQCRACNRASVRAYKQRQQP